MKEKEEVLVVRFFSYKGNDFVNEHNRICEREGKAWMLKVGRKLSEKTLSDILKHNNIVVLKAPKNMGGKYFCAKLLDYHLGLPKSNFVFPEYYQEMVDESIYDYTLDGTWFCFGKIEVMEQSEISKLFLKSNGKRISEVIDSTRTSVLYAVREIEVR